MYVLFTDRFTDKVSYRVDDYDLPNLNKKIAIYIE